MQKINQYLFNKKKLNLIMEGISIEELSDHAARCREIIANWCELLRDKIAEEKNEISLQDAFLSDFFGRILDYKAINESPKQLLSQLSGQADKEWHLYREKKSITDSTRSDAALGFFTPEHDDVRVIKGVEIVAEIQKLIDSTDKEIDSMVYELYGLTDKKIGIVEGTT